MPVERVDDVLYWNVTVALLLFALTEPFSVAVEVDTLDAADVVTVGLDEAMPVDEAVVKLKIEPVVVPSPFTPTTLK